MANQPETASYSAGVYQLEIADSVDGGVGAKSNAPLLALANRTAYLKQHMDAIEAGTMVPPGFALLASPAFTGTPTAPTQAAGDNSTKLATTAFVQTTVNGTVSVSIAGSSTTTLTQAQYGPAIITLTGAVTANKAVVFPNISGHWQVINNTTGAFTVTLKTAAGTGVVLTNGMSSNIYCDATNITLQQTDFISPALTGVPTAPTAASATNTTQIATTAYVQQSVNGMLTKSVAGGVDVTLTAAEAGYATLKFTGALTANINVIVPTTPGYWRVINGTSGAFTLTVKTAAGTGTGVTQGLNWGVICDGTNVIDGITDFYSVALTGVPTAPTAAAATSTTQIATTAFVTAADNLKANAANAALTGTPTAPTAAAGTTTTQLATTAFVQAAANGMLTKSVAGGATVTLTAAEAGNAILKFTGALTANISVVVPTATGTWTVINATTGAYTLTVKTSAGTGIAITQGLNWGVICDGTNVIDAITDFYNVALTGAPTTPTATSGTSTTQVASTAFVQDAIGGATATSVAGTGTTTLTAAQAGIGTIVLTGVLTGAKTAVLPTVKGHWTVVNNTTGAFSLTVKYATGTGVIVTQGTSTNIWGDAVNIALQQTDFVDTFLRGTPTATQAPRFDTSDRIMTAAAVQVRGVQYANFTQFSGTLVGTVAHMGGLVHCSGVGPNSYSLPDSTVNTLVPGSIIRVQNWGVVNLSLNVQGATDKMQEYIDGTWNNTTRVIQPDSYVDCMYIGTNYWLLSGPGVFGKTRPFSGLGSIAGWVKHPSGIIMQWTKVTLPSAATAQTVPLPTSYPNVHLAAFGTLTDSAIYGAGGAPFGCATPLTAGSVSVQSNYTASQSVVGIFSIGY